MYAMSPGTQLWSGQILVIQRSRSMLDLKTNYGHTYLCHHTTGLHTSCSNFRLIIKYTVSYLLPQRDKNYLIQLLELVLVVLRSFIIRLVAPPSSIIIRLVAP